MYLRISFTDIAISSWGGRFGVLEEVEGPDFSLSYFPLVVFSARPSLGRTAKVKGYFHVLVAAIGGAALPGKPPTRTTALATVSDRRYRGPSISLCDPW